VLLVRRIRASSTEDYHDMTRLRPGAGGSGRPGPTLGPDRRALTGVFALGVLLVAVITVTLTASIGRAGLPAGAGGLRPTAGPSAACPWLDSRLPLARRVSDLERAATVRQLATLMQLRRLHDGHEGTAEGIASLCIPPITEQDADVGVTDGPGGGSTIFASEEALAASFDPALARRIGEVIGAEGREEGDDLVMGPMVNPVRSSLWGRTYETFGEDPYLTTQMGVAEVAGIESAGEPTILKHFVAYSQETGRMRPVDDNAVVGSAELHEDDLPPFAAIIADDDPAGIMCSLNDVNGEPACANRRLLDTVLRGELHFRGFVRTDCVGRASDSLAATRADLAAGVSQTKCGGAGLYDPRRLAGHVSRLEIERAVTPYLRVLLADGLLDRPVGVGTPTRAVTALGRHLALEEDEQGSVLLVNRGVLPLRRGETVAVIGTAELAGGGSSRVRPSPSTLEPTLATALSRDLGGGVRTFEIPPGHPTRAGTPTDEAPTRAGITTAAAAAARADVAIVVVDQYEHEGADLRTLALPGREDRLVAAVAAANRHTVVVVESGGAVLMPWASDPHVGAILEQWYGGQAAGPAVAGLLSGRVNPSGHLPLTFPVSNAAQPDPVGPRFGRGRAARVGARRGRDISYGEGLDVGYLWYEAANRVGDDRPVAFPFGFGLSYSSFRFSSARARVEPDGSVLVSATVANVAGPTGVEVAQLYLGQPHLLPAGGDQYEPPRQLRGFDRVMLHPGQRARVSFVLTPGDLAHWSPATASWSDFAGRYRIFIGSSSTDLPLEVSVWHAAAALGADSGPTASS